MVTIILTGIVLIHKAHGDIGLNNKAEMGLVNITDE